MSALLVVSLLLTMKQLALMQSTRTMMTMGIAGRHFNGDGTVDTGGSYQYDPASTEHYVVQHAEELGYNPPPGQYASTCSLFNDPAATSNSRLYQDLSDYLNALDVYNNRIDAFIPKYRDLRKAIQQRMKQDHTITWDEAANEICSSLALHPDGLAGSANSIFPPHLLSKTSSCGYTEPLLPPMRHPRFCQGKKYLMSWRYIVHDFEQMCLTQLKPFGRTILIDMGSSFDRGFTLMDMIAMYVKFGFRFDHVYAYEITPTDPAKVFSRVPDEIKAAYHFINLGVSSDKNSTMNPFKMVIEDYNEDDFVIVKLDIDTPDLEYALVQQLNTDERLWKLVDQFYFEYHVFLEELRLAWKETVHGSVKDSLDLFYSLRQKGVTAHFWP